MTVVATDIPLSVIEVKKILIPYQRDNDRRDEGEIEEISKGR
jgi:hypothetical protein